MDTPAVPFTEVPFTIITDDAALARCCERWAQCEALAIDTEFMRVSTYYPKVALLQLADAVSNTLIDPLKISDWTPFAALMVNPAITKIFHSCSEDLLVFFAFLKLLPTPVFDTQTASAMLNEGSGLSYQNLVKNRFGIDLPKGETRSDWLQRPLTPEQLEYAALDIAYLQQTWCDQKQALETQGRLAWLQEDCARQQQQYSTEFTRDFSDYYLNFKAAWQLGPQQLAALQKLAQWREERARQRDKPRSWIIKDNALFAIANSMITNKAQLSGLEDVSDNFIRMEGEAVVELVRVASTMLQADCPPPLPKPLTQGQKNRLKAAQHYVESCSTQLNIPPEILGRKRMLQALQYALLAVGGKAENVTLPDELDGWRKPLLLDGLLKVFTA